jgi:coproporphyrinogen III oxidase-like Fe-S oxidoreductase
VLKFEPDRILDCDSSTEVSLEANPGDILGRVAAFQLAGVNRLSLGVQSLNDADLVFFNRDHRAAEALAAMAECRRVYGDRFSVDVIFGRPGQKVAAWLEELDRLVRELGVRHLSLYQLTVERGTPLHKLVNSGQAFNTTITGIYSYRHNIIRSFSYVEFIICCSVFIQKIVKRTRSNGIILMLPIHILEVKKTCSVSQMR